MSRRHVWRLVVATFVLSLADCAPLPESFTRVDGRHPDPNQLLNDEAICRGEIKKNLSTDNQTTIHGPTEDATAVYTVCMAQKGYRAEK
jgi:hypothetical protein